MNMLICALLLLASNSCIVNSSNNSENMLSNINRDSLVHPLDMTNNATLLNLGSDVEPILAWADYIGTFHQKEKNYSHIHGVRFCYVYDFKSDTVYYENLELRQGEINFNFTNCKISEQITGKGDILIENGTDSISMFNALENTNFKSTFNGIVYRKPLSVKFNNGELSYSDFIRVNIKKNIQEIYIVSFIDENLIDVRYKLYGNCNVERALISFVNRESGKIYFLDRNCYLYPLDEQDVVKLK